MANVKISDLTAYTDAASTDILPIVDIGNDVTKKITIGNVVKAVPLGTAADPGLAFDGDPNTGISSPGADQLAISTNAVERVEFGTSEVVFNDGGANYDFRIEGDTEANLVFVDASTDRVGIGTSSASARLHVRSATDDSTPIIRAQSNNATQHVDLGFYYINYDNGATSAPLEFQIDGATRMALSSTGLGIGTTSPGALLHLSATSGNQEIRLSDTTNSAMGRFYEANGLFIISETAHPIAFQTNALERARIDSSGRLLVGTSTARANFYNSTDAPRFQVEGTDTATSAISITRNSANAGYPTLNFGKTRGATVGSTTVVASGDVLGGVEFQGSDGTEFVQGASIRAEVDGTPGPNDMPGRLVFSTTADSASSPTERMRIDNKGSLCLGTPDNTTASPQDVNTRTFFYNDGASSGLYIDSRNSGAFVHVNQSFGDTANRSAIAFYRSEVPKGSISVDSSQVYYNTTSDYRLKENIVPLSSAIQKIEQLKPSVFNFIADPNRTVHGFIAHEVQDVVPEAVVGEKDAVDDDGNPIYQGIDQSKLVPLLTAALQEALAKIETLEARLTAAGI